MLKCSDYFFLQKIIFLLFCVYGTEINFISDKRNLFSSFFPIVAVILTVTFVAPLDMGKITLEPLSNEARTLELA